MEIGNKISGKGPETYGEARGGLHDFVMLKDMKQWDKIEGVFKGKFESKTKPGKFFAVFQNKLGHSIGYGILNKVLTDKIDKLKEELAKYPDPTKVYCVIDYWGQKAAKDPNAKPYYAFSDATLYQVNGEMPVVAAPESAPEASLDTSDIPF